MRKQGRIYITYQRTQQSFSGNKENKRTPRRHSIHLSKRTACRDPRPSRLHVVYKIKMKVSSDGGMTSQEPHSLYLVYRQKFSAAILSSSHSYYTSIGSATTYFRLCCGGRFTDTLKISVRRRSCVLRVRKVSSVKLK